MALKQQNLIRLVIFAALIGVWLVGSLLLNVETVLDIYARAAAMVTGHWGIAILAYTCLYGIIVAVGMPAASLMTLLGGAMFGALFGGIASVIGATAGACALFMLARGILKPHFQARTGPLIARISKEFHADAASYLLLARLTPVFPFLVVTLAAALLDAKPKAFAWTTLVGIIPATFAYSLVGSGVRQALSEEAARLVVCRQSGTANCATTLDLSTLISRDIILGLAALASIMLISLVVRRLMARTDRLPAQSGSNRD